MPTQVPLQYNELKVALEKEKAKAAGACRKPCRRPARGPASAREEGMGRSGQRGRVHQAEGPSQGDERSSACGDGTLGMAHMAPRVSLWSQAFESQTLGSPLGWGLWGTPLT